MLVIRRAQEETLGRPNLLTFIREMQNHLRSHFPEAMSPYADEQLQSLIEVALGKAAHFGIRSKRHACQFLNLCALYGWKFLDQGKNRWMLEKYLENPNISDPGNRIELLVDQCLWRLEVEEQNRRLRQEFDPERQGYQAHESGPIEGEVSVPLLEKEDI